MPRRSLFSTSYLVLACCATLLVVGLFTGQSKFLAPKTAYAATLEVNMQEYPYVYLPGSLTINVGDTVRWTNDGGSIHDVVSNDGYFDSGDLIPNYPPKRRSHIPLPNQAHITMSVHTILLE
ncbi:MAG: hypothetical protein HC782_02760 [Gammaproteobacteria bacterium]|nr:hypothetical protein [Gammaproteobacteria bacterium]